MGDDQINDYPYKFVSSGRYSKDLPGLNRNLLAAGTLYVAKLVPALPPGDAAATTFEWDLFVLAGNPRVHPAGDLQAGSANIDADNTFNSPDGLAFDQEGRLWIQTDGNFSNTSTVVVWKGDGGKVGT